MTMNNKEKNLEFAELKEKFILLRAKGYSFDRLTKELSKSKQTLINWSKEFEEEIANLKNIELEALNEQYFLSKEKKIEVFGKSLSNILREIEKRELSDVPTDKLMELFLKYYTMLESERTTPKFKSSSDINESKAEKEIFHRLTTSVSNTTIKPKLD